MRRAHGSGGFTPVASVKLCAVRRLSRKEHGVVDYTVAVLELALPAMLGAGSAARRLLRLSGANAALLGALTKHELGVVKLVPMRAHLALDGAFAAVFLAAPLMLRDEPGRVRLALAALGASGALIATFTDPDA